MKIPQVGTPEYLDAQFHIYIAKKTYDGDIPQYSRSFDLVYAYVNPATLNPNIDYIISADQWRCLLNTTGGIFKGVGDHPAEAVAKAMLESVGLKI